MDKLQPATYTITERGAHRAKKKKKKKERIHQQRFLSSHPAVQKRALERGKMIS